MGKLRLIDRRAVLLGPIDLLRLDCPDVATLRLGHIEKHNMRVQLRSGIAVYRSSAIVLELAATQFPVVSGAMISAHPGLDEMLHLVQRIPARFLDEPRGCVRLRPRAPLTIRSWERLNVASQPARCSIE